MGYSNFFATKLFTDIGANDNAISLDKAPSVTSGRLVLEARNPTQREIIKYSGVSGNQITGVLRGQGGTTAKPHIKNSLVEMNLTAEDLDDAIGVPNDIVKRASETFGDFVVDGTGVIAQTSGLVTSFPDITYYISGNRYTKTGLPNKTNSASKDIYVSIDTNGTPTYQEVANNAAQPALPASSLWVAKTVTNATAVTSVTLMNRGAVKSKNIDLKTYVDANGWTVRDYGAWKEYTKTSGFISVDAIGAVGSTNSGNYPVGVSRDDIVNGIATLSGSMISSDSRTDERTVYGIMKLETSFIGYGIKNNGASGQWFGGRAHFRIVK